MSRWSDRHGPVFDVVTPTLRERRREAMLARQRWQLRMTLLSTALVLLGLLVPAPLGIRLIFVVVGALVPAAVGFVVLGRRGR